MSHGRYVVPFDEISNYALLTVALVSVTHHVLGRQPIEHVQCNSMYPSRMGVAKAALYCAHLPPVSSIFFSGVAWSILDCARRTMAF
jgi:hypothetical protein